MKIVLAALKILKDILQKTCVYFTSMILIINILSGFLQTDTIGVRFNWHVTGWLTPHLIFMFILAAFLGGIASQVYKITKIPVFSRHLAAFILNYGIFFAVIIPMSNYTIHADTTLLLSVAFIAIYLVIFVIYELIKSAVKAVRNKKLNYDEVYKNAE